MSNHRFRSKDHNQGVAVTMAMTQLDPSSQYSDEKLCPDCGYQFDASAFDDDGLCAECAKEHRHRGLLKPRCIDCDTDDVDNAGDICPYCQECRNEKAKSCYCSCDQLIFGSELPDDICRKCGEYWDNQYGPQYRWYERLWLWVTRRL